MSAYKTALDTN